MYAPPAAGALQGAIESIQANINGFFIRFQASLYRLIRVRGRYSGLKQSNGERPETYSGKRHIENSSAGIIILSHSVRLVHDFGEFEDNLGVQHLRIIFKQFRNTGAMQG